MEEKIYITGHRNPDTDSICSAIAYADLLKKQGNENLEVIRLGNINPETKFILEYFGTQEPRLKTSIKAKVKDLEIDKPIFISKENSLFKALQIIKDNNINVLPVVDSENKLIGKISELDIAKYYTNLNEFVLRDSNTSIENILEVFNKKSTFLNEINTFNGKIVIYTMDSNEYNNISENDIVIVGNNKKIQLDVIDKNITLMIIAEGNDIEADVLSAAKANNVSIIATELDALTVSRLLLEAVPVSYIMSSEKPLSINLNYDIDKLINIIKETENDLYPVVDDDLKVMGSISKKHEIKNIKKNLILIDHNERDQSIEGIEQANILQIIDHHRIANIFTEKPIFFRAEPLGSSATIVSKMFFENNIIPSKKIAGILASAIISDTLLLRSPTTTETDKIILDKLGKIAELDVKDFAMKMFKAGTSIENKTAKELLNGDVKKFVIDSDTVRICQIFTMDLDSLIKIKDDLIEEMEEIRLENGETMFIVMFTDIYNEISSVLIVGERKEDVAKVFEKEIENNEFIVKGLLSRKKQMLPKVNEVFSKK